VGEDQRVMALAGKGDTPTEVDGRGDVSSAG